MKKKKIIIISIVAVILIIASLILADKYIMLFNGQIVNTLGMETAQEEKQKEEALNLAQEEFRKLGEETTKEALEIVKTQRKGEMYYYISAKENTLEIRIKDNKITKINSVPVE